MLKEVCEFLLTDRSGTYIDGTLGGGGHTAAILEFLDDNGKILSFDKDPAALDHCRMRFSGELSRESPRLVLFNQCFSTACSIAEGRGSATGVLLDLGLSSRQLDDSCRGFAHRSNSRLDMRFGSSGRSAEELLNAAKEEELVEILRQYGEEPHAHRIARRICERRRAVPLRTTLDLAGIVAECVPAKYKLKSLSRVFQAIRIAVNDELNVLENTLNNCAGILKTGGRIVIISYHSLEDRIVKNFFRSRELKIKKYAAVTEPEQATDVPKFKILTKKPLEPTEDEISRNPRVRSAKLRAAECII
jgi:16S rRNA (cytosine1402-N4)-methyltransferase